MRDKLTNATKFTYLTDALKDGPALNIIEGLVQMADSYMYSEAVSCLQNHDDRPLLVHQAHIRAILNIPSLRDGSGQELRLFHDLANQHLRPLKVAKHDSFVSLVMAIFEDKMDQTRMCKWQKYR